MSGERLAALAVDATIDYLDANLQAYLTAVETARGRAAGTLTAPVDIIGADLPNYGGGTPLIEVFENSAKPINVENEHWSFRLTVALFYGCDAAIETGHLFVRDYFTAVIDCLNAGRTLGLSNCSALVGDVNFDNNGLEGGQHLMGFAIDLDVTLFD
jgi:hypothetical protein